MKAKMYKYIFSILLVCFAVIGKAQTIDGKLYTQFNNWYKWKGGGFDSTLLLPQDSAATGKRPGAVYYRSADSSVYLWSGTQWRKVSGSIPTLQQVTTAGNTTTDSIKILKNGVNILSLNYAPTFGGNFTGDLSISSTLSNRVHKMTEQGFSYNNSIYTRTITNDVLSSNQTITFPDSAGRLAQRVAINGTTYNAADNGVIDLGNTDTATVVKAYVTNAEAVTITKGQVVYIFGAQGDRASVKLAKNTSDTFSSKTLGIVRADIAAGQAGWVTTQGQVSGINLGAYTAGDILWLDSVSGGFTKTKPVAPYHSVFVGVVERANAGNGLIYVKPQNGVELDEIHNVLINSPTNNQVLSYTASTGIWENKSVTTALGYTPLNVTDTAAMLSAYLRSITAPSGAGINLIKGTSQVKRLKAGSGITITDNTDSVTIASSGIAWDGIDSSFAAEQARRGRHEIEEFVSGNGSANSNLMNGASNYSFRTSVGSFAGFHDGNTQGVRITSAGVGFIFYGVNPTITLDNYLQLSTDWLVWTARVRIPTLSATGERFQIRVGCEAGLNNSSIVDGMAFVYDLFGAQTGSSASANWQTVTSKASTRTYNQNSSNVAVAENTWVRLKIVANSSNVYFYVNDTLIGNHTTNLPTSTNIYPLFDYRKNLGSATRTFEIDYSTIDIKYSTTK